jgi:predicted nucleic acid-binding protein
MSWLLDVNMILAARWTTHADHPAAKAWMDSVGEFSTFRSLIPDWQPQEFSAALGETIRQWKALESR